MNNLDNILPASEEGLYPIRTVSEVTGVNAITLRAWERRHGLFQPKRTPKGHRLYSEADILRIRQVLQLLNKGVAIGRAANALKNQAKIANFPELKIANKKASDGLDVTEDEWKTYRESFHAKISSFDAAQLEGLHHEVFTLYPIEIVSQNLIQPLLAELKTRAFQLKSLSGSYHFYCNFLKHRLGGLFLKSSLQNRGKKIVLMGVTDEQSDIDLLLFAMPLVTRGYQIVLLGCEVPFDAVPMTLSSSGSECLVLFVDSYETLDPAKSDALKTFVRSLQTPVFITGEYTIKQTMDLVQNGLTILPGNGAGQAAMIDQILANAAE